MKKIVKPKNLIAFKIWLEKLGYSVKEMQDGRGFNFRFKKEYGMVPAALTGNALEQRLGAEFEDHLRSPDFMEINLSEVIASSKLWRIVMRTEQENKLLQAIFNEMQFIKNNSSSPE